jgi:TPR repeat protein
MKLKSLFASALLVTCGSLWADTFTEGSNAFNRRDYSVALEKWKISASSGDSHASFNIGSIYYYGLGTQQNYYEALQWFKKATLVEDGRAEFLIGDMHLKGQGTAKDVVGAKVWLTIAELKGNKDASKVITSVDALLGNNQLAIANSYIELCKSKKLTSCSF